MSPSAEGAPHTLQRIALHHGNRRPHHQHDGVPYDHVEDHFALHRSLATSLRSAHTLPQVTVRVFIAVLLPLKHSSKHAIHYAILSPWLASESYLSTSLNPLLDCQKLDMRAT